MTRNSTNPNKAVNARRENGTSLATVAAFTRNFSGDGIEDALVFDSHECNTQCYSSFLILPLLYVLINQASEILNSPSQN